MIKQEINKYTFFFKKKIPIKSNQSQLFYKQRMIGKPNRNLKIGKYPKNPYKKK